MYTLYRSPAAFYECSVTFVIELLRTTTARKSFLHYPQLVIQDMLEIEIYYWKEYYHIGVVSFYVTF